MAKTKQKTGATHRNCNTNKTVCKDGKIKKKIPKLFTLFKCDVCNKDFTDKWNLHSHQKLHRADTPFQCPQCPYRGKTKKYVSRHMKRHGVITDQHKCTFCGKRFLYECNLKVHAMVHTGEKPHKCKVCGKAFRVTYSLNSHMLIHKDVKPFECSFCEYACRDSSTLRKHQNKHMGIQQKYECKICNKWSKTLAALKIHISEMHLDVDMHRFPCDRCGKRFKSNASRAYHITSVHDKALVCECPICGRKLANKHNLPLHMRTHLDVRPFSCTHPGCGTTFKEKSSLMKHMPIHDPALRVPCRQCGRTFARASHRTRHERVMHGRRRAVQCDYCGSRFYSKNYLRKHIQTKHVYKQTFKYICDICGLVTHNKPSIVMHLKYGHLNDGDLACKICNTEFSKHANLKTHYWRSHNIKYKMTRKFYENKKEEKPLIEIKVEPVETDSYEHVKFMDITKKEEVGEDDSLCYSKRVLSEDIACLLSAQRAHPHGSGPDHVFDRFFIRHVFPKPEGATNREPITEGVNEEKNQLVKKRIKQILVRTQKMEKTKKLKQDEKLQREKEVAEAKAWKEKEKQEIVELMRVREMYNERMKAFANKKDKKEQVTIKYFKKKPEESNTTVNEADDLKDDGSNDELESVDDDLPLSSITEAIKKNCDNTETRNKIDVSHETEPNDSTNKVNTSDNANLKDDETANVKEDIIDETNEHFDKNNKRHSENNSLTHNEKTHVNEDNEMSTVINDITPSSNEQTVHYNTNVASSDRHDITPSKLNADSVTEEAKDNTDKDYADVFNQPLKKRLSRKRVHKYISDSDESSDNEVVDDDESWKGSDEEVNKGGKARKIEFRSHQCNICFKLYPTKAELISHCQEHFDVCNERTLTKCPMCTHVSYKSLTEHMKKSHNVTFKIPVFHLKDRKNVEGSRYCYDVNGTIVEVIPSVKILNKHASLQIDRKKREFVDKRIAKSKLVKKGNEWIVEKEAVDVKFDEIPEFANKELAKCKVSDNDVDRLAQLNYLAKKKGLKIMFPCFDCSKICQGLSALKLHMRRHQDNPKPFRPREKRPRFDPRLNMKEKKKVVDVSHRTALPKPIVNKHKCDPKLIQFYENNIRGSNIEFWQFLKIYNRMERENVNDFKDLEGRTDFGIHYSVGDDGTDVGDD